jgi:hypothetical protein
VLLAAALAPRSDKVSWQPLKVPRAHCRIGTLNECYASNPQFDRLACAGLKSQRGQIMSAAAVCPRDCGPKSPRLSVNAATLSYVDASSFSPKATTSIATSIDSGAPFQSYTPPLRIKDRLYRIFSWLYLYGPVRSLRCRSGEAFEVVHMAEGYPLYFQEQAL